MDCEFEGHAGPYTKHTIHSSSNTQSIPRASRSRYLCAALLHGSFEEQDLLDVSIISCMLRNRLYSMIASDKSIRMACAGVCSVSLIILSKYFPKCSTAHGEPICVRLVVAPCPEFLQTKTRVDQRYCFRDQAQQS